MRHESAAKNRNSAALPHAPGRASTPLAEADSSQWSPDAGPAKRLQAHLHTWINHNDARWSARKSLAFVVFTCSTFWAGVIALAIFLLSH